MRREEEERRKQQSIKSNPQKYYNSCLKRGCCKNCTKNVEAEQKVSSPTVFGSYFTGASAGFGSTQKYRKCAAQGHQILNEYERCSMYERESEASVKDMTKKKQVTNTIFGIK